jgi:hypothetical protein
MTRVFGLSKPKANLQEQEHFAFGSPRRGCCFILLAASIVACRPSSHSQPSVPRYLVSGSPIDIGLGPSGLCVAVDPNDPHGVWWWEPGTSGCASRSTGPKVFHGDEATVSQPTHKGPIVVSFHLGTHSVTRPFISVRLVIEDDNIRMQESGARVAIQGRTDLDVPEMPGRGQR